MTDVTVPAPRTAPIAYSGPWEVLLNQPVVLKGTFDPQRVVKVTVIAEDKFQLNVVTDHKSGAWQVNMERGFTMAGARWLRLRGADGQGSTIDDQIIYITVSVNPLTVGQDLSLKVLVDTPFKATSEDSSKLDAQNKVLLKAGQTFGVTRYGFVDGHLKLELTQAVPPLGNFGFVYEKHVQLSKGSQVLVFDVADVPTTKLSAILLVTTTTPFKRSLADSSTLPGNQKLDVLQGQTFQITGYACVAGHFRVTLAQPIQNFGDTGYLYWQHVLIKRGDQLVPFDQEALTVTALRSTIIKKRPVDSSQLRPEERVNFPANTFYGVSSYSLESGHIKVALTEEFPNFGNTGFVFPDFVQLKRGGGAFNPVPPQVELNVPYFSQRDNPRLNWATCNVTSIAMMFYYYGIRSKNPSQQLEDELLQWCVNRYGPGCQTDNNVLSQMIRAYGFDSSFSTTRRWADVRNELINRRPVVLGGDFTASGHIVCLIGFTSQGYIVNDPWGNALTGYRDTEGRKLLYPNSYMDRVAGPDGNIWAHFTSKRST